MTVHKGIMRAVEYHTDIDAYEDYLGANEAALFYIGEQLRIQNLIAYSKTIEGAKNPAVAKEIAKVLGF